jgi:hypothetical protein
MNLKSILVLAIVAIRKASFVVAPYVPEEDNNVINAGDDEDRHEPSRRQLRRLVPNSCWLKRIAESYTGKDLKTCPRRKAPPASGSKCGKEIKTCFFDTQDCPTVGCHPVTKCSCNGTLSQKGTWTCVAETCPMVDTQEGSTTTIQKAPGSLSLQS